MNKPAMLMLAEIVSDDATQWRAKNSSKAIEDMVEHLRSGGDLPAIDVFVDKKNIKRVADGHHRVGAYRAAGLDKIPARLHKGDADDAFLFGWRANRDNRSVRARHEDVRNAALQMLQRKLIKSDNKLAEELGVNQSTISRWRAEWESTYALHKSPKREGADGRTTNVSNIGKRSASDSTTAPWQQRSHRPERHVQQVCGTSSSMRPTAIIPRSRCW